MHYGKEIKTSRKIYFYDNGVRNAVIGAFQPFAMRNDIGPLWENFLVAERLKQLKYRKVPGQVYFWRTKQQQEVDFVEERNGKIYGFEFKWKDKSNRFPKTFTQNYNAEAMVVSRSNFRDFVIPKDLKSS